MDRKAPLPVNQQEHVLSSTQQAVVVPVSALEVVPLTSQRVFQQQQHSPCSCQPPLRKADKDTVVLLITLSHVMNFDYRRTQQKLLLLGCRARIAAGKNRSV